MKKDDLSTTTHILSLIYFSLLFNYSAAFFETDRVPHCPDLHPVHRIRGKVVPKFNNY